MEFYDVLKRRRSVRKFVPSEITDDVLLRIVDAGRIAPSGCNLQNREFIVIRDRETLTALHEKIQPDMANAAAAIALVMDPKSTDWGEFWREDAAAATESMLLAIANEGYDSVWIEGTLHRHEPWAKELLNVPDDRRLFILLPIGKAANQERLMAPKADLEKLIHYERFGA